MPCPTLDIACMTIQPPDDRILSTGAQDQPFPVLSNRMMAWAAAALVVLRVGLAAWLLLAFGNGKDPA